jgi:hypothetical protein
MAAGAVVAGVVRTAENFSALALNETLAIFWTCWRSGLTTSSLRAAPPLTHPLAAHCLQTVEDRWLARVTEYK